MAVSFVTSVRRLLIKFGKSLPFILCFVIGFSYAEAVVAMLTDRVVYYSDFAIPYMPISYKLASIFEYDWLTILAMTILCYAIETCVWNKIGILYAACQLLFKNYIVDYTFDPWAIYTICAANIAVSGYLAAKGIRILITKFMFRK